MKKLSDYQVEDFDTEYVKPEMWESFKKKISLKFGSKPFQFLDIGGGNGLFADKILETFPGSTCLLIDNSEVLLNKNTINDRKTLLNESIENISSSLADKKFDIILLHWVLHHLVENNYTSSINNIEKTIKIAKKHLCDDNGVISIYENLYDGYPIHILPSHIIYNLTSNKFLAPLIRRLGANTAGCGVCFLSLKKWNDVISNSGLTIIDCEEYEAFEFSFLKKLLLNLHLVRIGHFWCDKV